MVGMTGLDLHFDLGKIKDCLRRAVGGNSPSDCCIKMGSSPVVTLIKDKREAEASLLSLVRMTGLEPARSRVGT